MRRVEVGFAGPVLFETRLEVRVSDLNYGNHLGHDALVGLLHEARVRFFADHGMAELDLDGLAAMVVGLAVRYRGEALLGDRLRIEIAAGEVGSRAVELLYRVTRDDDRRIAEASTTLVLFNRGESRVAPVPDRLLALVTGRAEI